MLDITVKTLDGRNRTFSVPDNITVRQFKEKIATSIEIPADTQRLIFQGRVLVDEKEINDYDVNGKTIHVVQKPPPSSAGNSAQSERSGATNRSRAEGQRSDGNSFVLGSFSMPADSADGPTHMRNVVQQMFSGMSDMGGSRGPPTSVHGPSVDVHINIGRGNSSTTEIHNRVNNATQMLASIRRILNRLENSSVEESVEEDSNSQQFQPSASSSENVGGANGGGPQSASPPTQNLSPSVLSSLLDEVLSIQERLRPHILRYRQLLNDDQNYADNTDEMQRAQNLGNMTAEALHLFSHAYHNISDLLVDFSSAPPRQLRAQTIPTAAAIVQQTIPVQINVTHVPVSLANLQSAQQTQREPSQREPQQQQQQQPTTTTSSTTQTPPSSSANAPRPPQGFPGLPPGFPAGFPMGFAPGLPPGFPVPGAFMPPGAAAGAGPMPHSGGMPGGFHVFMEMGPGGNMSGGGRPWPPGAGMAPQGPVDGSSAGTGAGGIPAGAGSSGQRPETGETAGGSTGGAVFPPGDFMQNLIHMATDAMFRAQAAQTSGSQSTAGGTSVDPVQSTGTTPSVPLTEPASSGRHAPAANSNSATPTHTSQLPPGRPYLPPPSLAGQSEAMFPGAIDPYLPCNSRHFMGHRPLGGAAATTTTTTTGLNTGSQSIGQSLAGVVSNIMSSLVQPLTGNAPPHFSATSSTSASAAGSTSTRTAASAAGTPQPATGLDVFASMMQGITNELMQTTQGGQSTRSIADFLHQLGSDYDLPQGEGLFTDLFHIVAGQLAFTDLMSIFFGVSAPLERLREPLRQFVADDILNGSEPTDANIDAAVERLIADMQSDIDTIAGDVQTIDNIDYRETITIFIRSHLRNVIRLIVNANLAESGFAAGLFEFCRSFVHGYIVLGRRCIAGGQGALERHILDRMRNISADVSPAMQATMSSVAIQQLRQIVPSLTEADVAQYIVYRSATATDATTATDAPIESVSSDSSFASACDGDDMSAAHNEDQPSNMDTTDVDGLTFDAQATSTRIDPALLSSVTPPTDVDSDDADIQVVYGSEDWHTAVPNDWIPVITRDVIQQNRQTSYPPLSDAYLTGMPTKRRRLMTQDRHRDEVADVQTAVFPNVVNRAIENAGAHPTTSQSELQQDLVNNEQLGAAFRRELNTTIQRRLASDSDFVQSKYPNTEKFFNSR